MTPMIARFYVYADDQKEIGDLEQALREFVSRQYDSGVIVTARRLTELISRIGPATGPFLR